MDQKPENQNNFRKKHRYYDKRREHGGEASANIQNTEASLPQAQPDSSSDRDASANFNHRHHKHKPNQHKTEEALAPYAENNKPTDAQPVQTPKPQPVKAEQSGINANQKPRQNNDYNRNRYQNRPNRDDSAVLNEENAKREPRQPRFQNVQNDRRNAVTEEVPKNEDAVKFRPASEPAKASSNTIPGPEVLDDIPRFTKIASSDIENFAEKVKVVGIQFKTAGKVYYFDPGDIKLSVGSHAIVETARGLEFGEVIFDQRMVSENSIVKPLRPVIREATPEDIAHNKENEAKEESIFKIGQEKIAEHKLDMKLVDAQYTFDNSKLLFYFTSAGRVDFRELVKDLAGVFHTRIELRQIGIRDEAKMMGGLGACGRPLCCASFLADFVQVSIKMAKEQGLSLNSNKISGACGRLMCCLHYESDSYEAELRLMPPLGSKVKTPDGVGFITELSPISGTIKVNLEGQDAPLFKVYKKDDITVISRPSVKSQPDADNDSDVLPNE